MRADCGAEFPKTKRPLRWTWPGNAGRSRHATPRPRRLPGPVTTIPPGRRSIPPTLSTKLQATAAVPGFAGRSPSRRGRWIRCWRRRFGPAGKGAQINVYLNGKLLDDKITDVSKILVPGKNTVLLEIQSRLGEDTGMLVLSLWHRSPLTTAPGISATVWITSTKRKSSAG